MVLFIVLVTAGVIALVRRNATQEGPLLASGSVEGLEIQVASELAGRVTQVLVREGDAVEVGEELLRLDDSLLLAQRKRAEAMLATLQAALATAQAGRAVAEIQYDIALERARAQELATRANAWRNTKPAVFSLPLWYFEKSEQIAAAQAEVSEAEDALQAGYSELGRAQGAAGAADLIAAEARLAQAESAYRVAQQVLERAQAARDRESLEASAGDLLEQAEAELEEAQEAYDGLAADEAATAVFEARAKLAIAQARYDAAQDQLSQLATGPESLQVRAADAAVEQAKKAVNQAEQALAQAQAELYLIDLQLEKLVLRSPIAGVVIGRHVQPGAVIPVGGAALTLVQLDDLTITVYLLEDRYGQVSLSTNATVSVDSFPGESFTARVVRIADRAEFTPRNVQTEEGRRTTVFAVELAVDNPGGRLKPGMPADVQFELP
ncbi:MAG TPA: HlyD family efflux transporter periplasmic adaptor subunit [Anaerolineales bacterium]|nr:HlyD family efflux transporter periplasmic adaptor subunit [Anaerolineales bacterium]